MGILLDGDKKNISVIGGGMSAVAVLSGIVAQAKETPSEGLDVSIFERSDMIGPGLPYGTDLPDSFLLNHELNHMGSINPDLDDLDEEDFFNWIQENKTELKERYSAYNLDDPDEFVPRSLYGLYLRDRYETLKHEAELLGITVHEYRQCVVSDIIQGEDGMYVLSDEGEIRSDICVLATGNWFRNPSRQFPESAKAFSPYPNLDYLDKSKVGAGSTLLIKGTGLTAYDIAIAALEGDVYDKVTMASRRGNIRMVRGRTAPYDRKFLTLENLESLAGGPKNCFRLQDVLSLLGQELREIYGRDIEIDVTTSVSDIIDLLEHNIGKSESGEEMLWRSLVLSIGYDERNEIYERLDKQDKDVFLKWYYSSVLNMFAPMPLTNARKLLDFVKQGRLEIENGFFDLSYDEAREKFVLKTRKYEDGTPCVSDNFNHVSGRRTFEEEVEADVFVDAGGISRDTKSHPLFSALQDRKMVDAYDYGGLDFYPETMHVMRNGVGVPGLYCVGQMQIGKTIQPVNSLIVSQTGRALGQRVYKSALGLDLSADLEASHLERGGDDHGLHAG